MPKTEFDPLEYGRASAIENDQASGDAEVRNRNESRFQETMDDARESARLNREVEESQQSDNDSNDLANDTSDEAKIATAKSQLDPAGDDPIDESEIKDSALNASMDTGNKTAVDNEEAAERAKNPGEAEENAPHSTANPNAKPVQNATTEEVSEASTSNRRAAKRSARKNS